MTGTSHLVPWGWLVAGLVVIGLAVLAYAGFLAGRYFFVARYPDEIHFARASDGWRIAVVRYRPLRGDGPAPPARAWPVLLIHGLAANRYNLDLDDQHSLARWLAAAGWDVWVVELRGRGLSTRPRLFSGLHYDWCFDEYVERDLPAAAAAILEATRAPRLHLVGFSTGALAAYAFLSDGKRTAEVASLVALAGPASFRRASKALSGGLIRALRFLRHRWLMRLLAPATGLVRPLGLLYNAENTDGPTQRRMMVNMIANFSRNELLQYSDWILHDAFRSIDHRRDYRAELGRLAVPTLFLAGARDPLAPADAVKEAFEAVGSTDKQFKICSRAQGLSANYGHYDLVLGPNAPGDVFPLVGEWLSTHDGEARRAAAGPAPQVSATTTSIGTSQ